MITCMSEHLHDLVKKCVEEHPDLPAEDKKAILAGLDKMPRCDGSEKMGFADKCESNKALDVLKGIEKERLKLAKDILPIVAMGL